MLVSSFCGSITKSIKFVFVSILLSQDRALTALTGSAKLHHLRKFIGPQTKLVASSLSSAGSQPHLYDSPFPFQAGASARLSQASSCVVNYPGATYGRLGYQAFGYGQGAVSALNSSVLDSSARVTEYFAAGCSPYHLFLQKNSRGMADTVMKWHPKRQGMPGTFNLTAIDQSNLAHIIKLGEDAVWKRIENARISSELLWQHEVSRALNKAVQPEAYAAAERSIAFIADQTGPLLAERIQKMHNRLFPGELK